VFNLCSFGLILCFDVDRFLFRCGGRLLRLQQACLAGTRDWLAREISASNPDPRVLVTWVKKVYPLTQGDRVITIRTSRMGSGTGWRTCLAAQSDSPSARGGWGLMPRNKRLPLVGQSRGLERAGWQPQCTSLGGARGRVPVIGTRASVGESSRGETAVFVQSARRIPREISDLRSPARFPRKPLFSELGGLTVAGDSGGLQPPQRLAGMKTVPDNFSHAGSEQQDACHSNAKSTWFGPVVSIVAVSPEVL
jgi:hypothetical protein